nr:MAG TPA: hypothetical protein [Caudoviricetes sp.]
MTTISNSYEESLRYMTVPVSIVLTEYLLPNSDNILLSKDIFITSFRGEYITALYQGGTT